MATPPRRILPGRTILLTRRCSERRFFLVPRPETTAIFVYVLAVAAKRYGMLVHSVCVMSNHVHVLLTDVRGVLPVFVQFLDSLVARAVNAALGRFEAFWAKDGGYSAVEPLEAGDVVAKAAYVLANPVAAGLVKKGSEWPGLWTGPELVGGAPIKARRPKEFFDPKGTMPEEAELGMTAPPGFEVEEFRALLAQALREAETRHQAEHAEARRRFIGVARVMSQSPFARPAPPEPRFGLKPRLAARNKWKRIEAIQRLKSFLSEYREAWRARRSGVPGVLFPAGTYLLRLMHGVQCAGAA